MRERETKKNYIFLATSAKNQSTYKKADKKAEAIMTAPIK